MRAFLLLVILGLVHPYAHGQVDPRPVGYVKWSLRNMKPVPTLTYEVAGELVFCKAHCRDLAERDAVYDIFRGIPNGTLSSTSDPPTATVVLPMNPQQFERNQQFLRWQGEAQQARRRQEEDQRTAELEMEEKARETLSRLIETKPKELYGKRIAVTCKYEDLDRLPGDKPYELGFAVRENGIYLPCVVFTSQVVGDPYTGSIPVVSDAVVRRLRSGDKLRLTGRVFAPSGLDTSALPSLRRARPFFVVERIEKL